MILWQYSCNAAVPTKTLKFPKDIVVAQLYCYKPPTAAEARAGVPYHESRLLAKGTVVLPTDLHIGLKLTFNGLDHLNELKQINAFQVNKLDAADLEFEDSHMEQLKDFTSIWRVNLDSTSITDKSVAILGRFKSMNDMRLSKVDISGDNFELLTGLPLGVININGSNLKEGNLSRIKSLPDTLTNLNVSRTGVGPRDTAFLGKCKKLTSLNIGGNKKITDACMKDLVGLKMLDNLYVDDTQVTEKSLPLFAQMPRLRKLIVRNRTFWKVAPGKSPRAGLTIEDSVIQSRTPVDVFAPLH